MTKTAPVTAFAALAVIAAGLIISCAKSEMRILVFSKTAGYRHQSIVAGKQALFKLARERGFEVDTTENSDDFNEQTLQKYDALMFLCTSGEVLNEAQQEAMRRFIQNGGGFIGIHSAADTEYEWEWYGRLVGAYFNAHPNDPNVREGAMAIVDPQHEATQKLPSTWKRMDEWYDYKSVQTDLKVLITVDEASYKRSEENPQTAPHAIAWYHEFDGGRAFYTGLGHTSESYAEALFLEHVYGGLKYATGK